MALLDEVARKKSALDRARPLPQSVVHELADEFEFEMTMTCAEVEGLGLGRDEVARVLTKGPILRNRSAEAQSVVLNHVDALRLMARLSFEDDAVVTERTVAAFHAVLFRGIDGGAGKYREGALDAADGGGAPDPAKTRVSMSALSGWLRRSEASLDTAFEAHHRLMCIRPFSRGNAAVALLLCNLILNRAGYPPAIIRAEDRDVYHDTVERARVLGDKTQFREVMARLVEESLDLCLAHAARAGAAGPGAGGAGPRG